MAPSNGVFSQTDKDPQRTHPSLPFLPLPSCVVRRRRRIGG